jgi:hypothetical protein
MNDEDTKALLRDILKWQRLQGIKTLREIIPSMLDSDEKRLVYENTDGQKTARDLLKIVNTGLGTISRCWNEWYSQGILEKRGQKYQKVISLKELSIPVGRTKEG